MSCGASMLVGSAYSADRSMMKDIGGLVPAKLLKNMRNIIWAAAEESRQEGTANAGHIQVR
jgi:hypothetical protein